MSITHDTIENTDRDTMRLLEDTLEAVKHEILLADTIAARSLHYAPGGPGTNAACGWVIPLRPRPATDDTPLCPVCADVAP